MTYNLIPGPSLYMTAMNPNGIGHCPNCGMHAPMNQKVCTAIDCESSSDQKGNRWLMDNHPKAYKALPEPYKNDSCLVFYLDSSGFICAKPAPGQEYALGDSVWYYSEGWMKWFKQR